MRRAWVLGPSWAAAPAQQPANRQHALSHVHHLRTRRLSLQKCLLGSALRSDTAVGKAMDQLGRFYSALGTPPLWYPTSSNTL